jgi:hypothetical protein
MLPMPAVRQRKSAHKCWLHLAGLLYSFASSALVDIEIRREQILENIRHLVRIRLSLLPSDVAQHPHGLVVPMAKAWPINQNKYWLASLHHSITGTLSGWD